MRDLYEQLIKSYEFAIGPLPHRDRFKEALTKVFEPDDLRVVFLLPLTGETTMGKIQKKAAKAGIPLAMLNDAIERLLMDGLVQTFKGPSGDLYQRGILISLIELQIRKAGESPLRQICAEIMDAMHEGQTRDIPTRTPYYRVLPVESTLMAEADDTIAIDAMVPDPREVLPLDIVTEMIRGEPLVAVTDCACRKAKRVLNKGCDHPLQTCLAFNKYAQALMRSGIARQIDHEEAIQIVRDSEALGLIHNVSNCQDHIEFICNCCVCSCGLMASIRRGQTNALASSRYVVEFDDGACVACEECVSVCPVNAISVADSRVRVDQDKCIGCGLCVAACTHSARRMVLRDKAPKIPADARALNRQINREAMIGLALNKVLGRG